MTNLLTVWTMKHGSTSFLKGKTVCLWNITLSVVLNQLADCNAVISNFLQLITNVENVQTFEERATLLSRYGAKVVHYE